MDREKQANYVEHIKPLLERVAELAQKYALPFLAVCEVDDMLMIHKYNLAGCSELACAYRELTGEWEEEE